MKKKIKYILFLIITTLTFLFCFSGCKAKTEIRYNPNGWAQSTVFKMPEGYILDTSKGYDILWNKDKTRFSITFYFVEGNT